MEANLRVSRISRISGATRPRRPPPRIRARVKGDADRKREALNFTRITDSADSSADYSQISDLALRFCNKS
jgi:hypothetical protein